LVRRVRRRAPPRHQDLIAGVEAGEIDPDLDSRVARMLIMESLNCALTGGSGDSAAPDLSTGSEDRPASLHEGRHAFSGVA
jgi:hypothetical protein